MDERELARTLGRNIRALREKRRLSREVLAGRAGCHPNWLGSIERGERNASVMTLVRIAVALSVPPGKLLADLPASVTDSKSDRRGDAALHNDLEIVLRGADPEARAFIRRMLRSLRSWLSPSSSAKRRSATRPSKRSRQVKAARK